MKIKLQLLRKVALTALCALAVATASAEVKYLIVSRTDGSKASFAFADDPVVRNSASELTVESSASSIAVPFADLLNYYFSETDLVGVEEINSGETHSYRDGKVTFTGLTPGSQILVFSMEGREVLCCEADSEGFAFVDLNGLGTGVYIVRTGNSSFKFAVK